MHIAIIQQNIHASDKAANYATIQRLVKRAVSGPVPPDLIVLPELWSTGYALKEMAMLASDAGQEEAAFLGELARQYNVWFAGGSVAAKTSLGISNRAQIINRQGKLEAFYDKIHLVPMLDEHKYLTAGNSFCVHPIEGICFGFAICYDIRFCEFIRQLALKGAETLIVAAQWPLVRLNHWQILLQARAIENQCYLFAANNGASGNAAFAGHSLALAPDGSIIDQLKFQEGILQVQIDTEKIAQIRKAVPVFDDRRTDLYEITELPPINKKYDTKRR